MMNKYFQLINNQTIRLFRFATKTYSHLKNKI